MASKRTIILLILLAVLVVLAALLQARYLVVPEDSDTTWVYVAGSNLTTYVADTPGERYCGYYCYDTEAIAFLWPEGTPPKVSFTMEGLEFEITLLHVRDCRVVESILMEPGGLYTVYDVEPRDWFIEIKGALTVEPGTVVQSPLCRGDSSGGGQG